MNEAISIKNLRKQFNGKEVFHDLNIEVKKGKITAIFGPNGCGKSTLFNILAGLIKDYEGEYIINDFHKFKFSYIPQNYRDSLLPWRTGFENIALPLKIQGRHKKEIKEKINYLEKHFGFNLNLYKYPYELSGGQQQLLIFMRALITGPDILLLDEPFSALDYENNLRLRSKLQKYYLETNATVFIITHNIEEAVHLAHDIVILSKTPTRVIGRINNPLDYPRTLNTLKLNEFKQMKDHALEIFRTAVNL